VLEGVIPLETFPLAEWHLGELADVPRFTVLKTQICVTRARNVLMKIQTPVENNVNALRTLYKRRMGSTERVSKTAPSWLKPILGGGGNFHPPILPSTLLAFKRQRPTTWTLSGT
jgi:hypothetical protein